MTDASCATETVTVVIPAYNREHTIGYCLESVLRQTVSPLEIIVVDDCSSDNTVAVVKSFANPRIRCVVQQTRSGAQAARNRGIREAKGIWIAFLDSDDEWLPEKLERQLTALRRCAFHPFTVVHTNCWKHYSADGRRKICSVFRVHGDRPLRLLLRSSGPLFPGILVSKTALEKIGLLDEAVPSYQEWDTCIRLAMECEFIHIQQPLFVYHIHPGDTISKNRLRDITGYQYIIDKYRSEIIRQCGTDTFENHLLFNALKAAHWGYRTEAGAILAMLSGATLKARVVSWLVNYAKGIVSSVWFISLVERCNTIAVRLRMIKRAA